MLRLTHAMTAVLLLCMGISAGSVFSEPATVLRGQVVNQENGEPLPNAAVSLPAYGLSTACDAQGRFLIRIPLRSDSPQSVELKASAEGFAPETRNVSLVEATITLNFALRLSYEEEITVGAPGEETVPPEQTIPERVPPLIGVEVGTSSLEGILEERKPMKGRLHFRFGFESRYDDNLYQYSERNLDRFDPNLPKFLEIGGVSDVAFSFPARVDFRFSRKSKARLSFVFEPQFYTNNPERNHQTFHVGWEQKLSHDMELNVRYFGVPSYFFLRLADPPNQTRTYARASHNINSVDISLQKDFSRRLSAEISLQYATKNYSQDFSHLDSDATGFNFEFYSKLTPSLRILAGGGLERSITRGRNDPRINYDNSYNWWTFYVSPSVDITKWLTVVGEITHSPKSFLSDLPDDINHFGRNDSTWMQEITLKLDLSSSYDLRLKYERITKSSQQNGETLEFPNFTENRISTAVYYEF